MPRDVPPSFLLQGNALPIMLINAAMRSRAQSQERERFQEGVEVLDKFERGLTLGEDPFGLSTPPTFFEDRDPQELDRLEDAARFQEITGGIISDRGEAERAVTKIGLRSSENERLLFDAIAMSQARDMFDRNAPLLARNLGVTEEELRAGGIENLPVLQANAQIGLQLRQEQRTIGAAEESDFKTEFQTDEEGNRIFVQVEQAPSGEIRGIRTLDTGVRPGRRLNTVVKKMKGPDGPVFVKHDFDPTSGFLVNRTTLEGEPAAEGLEAFQGGLIDVMQHPDGGGMVLKFLGPAATRAKAAQDFNQRTVVSKSLLTEVAKLMNVTDNMINRGQMFQSGLLSDFFINQFGAIGEDIRRIRQSFGTELPLPNIADREAALNNAVISAPLRDTLNRDAQFRQQFMIAADLLARFNVSNFSARQVSARTLQTAIEQLGGTATTLEGARLNYESLGQGIIRQVNMFAELNQEILSENERLRDQFLPGITYDLRNFLQPDVQGFFPRTTFLDNGARVLDRGGSGRDSTPAPGDAVKQKSSGHEFELGPIEDMLLPETDTQTIIPGLTPRAEPRRR